MTSRLLDKLSAMCKDKCLGSIFIQRWDAGDKLCEDDLKVVSRWQIGNLVGTQTVLPLPVASDIPRRLWPLSRKDKTDWIHSS